jgi:thioredoxin 1
MDELEQVKLRKMKELMGMASVRRGFPNTPIVLTDTNLKEVVNQYPLVVIDCWAPWCNPCLMIAPIIDELAKEYAGRIVFGKLNVDENPNAARAFRIMSIPTLLIIKGGNEVDRIVGALPKLHVVEKLQAYLVRK